MSIPTENPGDDTFWDVTKVHASNPQENIRTTERHLEKCAWLPAAVKLEALQAAESLNSLVLDSLVNRAKRKRQQVLIVQSASEPGLLVVNDGRLGRRWRFADNPGRAEDVLAALDKLCADKSALLLPMGNVTALCREIVERAGGHEVNLPSGTSVTFGLTAYPANEIFRTADAPASRLHETHLTHLDRLEAESIHIMREVVAQAENPVMLYSVGKDSSVMLHLARKAFYPSPPPFPLMHVDTRWKFKAMYDFRDYMAKEVGMDLIVHINPEGVDKDINPFDHGSSLHTDVMKTQGLKQALDMHGFDVAFGGARRDEEKSRAKERVFSFRNAAHRWDPKNQRPELWNLYNGYKAQGDSIRAFPLSNWTELDIWQYIYREQIPIVPLYFSAERPVVERDGTLIMVDDERMRLLPDEEIQTRRIRFRTLGCYPLTGAVDSDADDLSSIVLELLQSRTSERQGRAIDSDSAGSMEKKKQEGYF